MPWDLSQAMIDTYTPPETTMAVNQVYALDVLTLDLMAIGQCTGRWHQTQFSGGAVEVIETEIRNLGLYAPEGRDMKAWSVEVFCRRLDRDYRRLDFTEEVGLAGRVQRWAEIAVALDYRRGQCVDMTEAEIERRVARFGLAGTSWLRDFEDFGFSGLTAIGHRLIYTAMTV